MDHALSDPSDWLNTSLTPFCALETSLRCQVCKDFFSTPMVTTCSHTFCSICIRRCLSVDGKCPACRANDQASKLRRNWALEEVVGAFVTARPVALDIATKDKKEKEEVSTRPSKRRRTERYSGGASEVTVRTTRSQSKRTTQNDQPAVYDGAADEGSDAEYTEPSTTQPERQQTPDDGLVACPICQTRMKEETVFNHIGSSACTSPSQKARQQKQKPSAAPSQPPAATKPLLPDRLTELNYSLLNEKALRKKLQELGIPSTGSKTLLSRRHTEYVNLWNANVDAEAPRSKRELLAELAKWDRSIGRDYADGAGGGIAAAAQGNNVMKKDFDAKAWEKGNKDDFARLIAEARKGRGKAMPKPDSTAEPPTEQPKESQAQQPDPMALDPPASTPRPPSQVEPETDLPRGYHNASLPQENFPSVDNPPPSGQRVKPPPLPSRETSLPEKFGAEGGQKVDMFEVSSHPVADVETMSEAGGGGER
ncbi:DNA repair protein rad18 [Aureobasidium namibiae CBS 147.97]|uniref:Postreplication repair E3 ubiquitin-protein ligase RAD18 n=1 Tax=Aureobasidium namibiae CBS 147.97 TaxID=1043004 RepID=A0A074XP24_9PEZI